ncbi:MAG TPA: molybdate ABC transporter substrate-binding protein [Acidimicrobiia bacterium]
MIAHRRSSLGLVLAVTVVLGLGARCGDEEPKGSAASTSSSPTTAAAGNLTVLAAASLSESFKELGTAFEAKHPGSKVTFSFDSSSALAAQANNAVPADLFASADQANMKKVTDAGNATGPKVFAHNKLAIIVAKGNPKKIKSLADFTRVSFVLCAPEVPCGKYGVEALSKAAVKAQPKSLETNVKGVVTKITSGEADAGIGYVTDAKAAANAEGIEIPDAQNVVAEYPVAVLKQSANSTLAQAFLDFIVGAEAQAVLAKYGFAAA